MIDISDHPAPAHDPALVAVVLVEGDDPDDFAIDMDDEVVAARTLGWRMGSDLVMPTYGHDLSDAQALPFVPAKGALGLYEVAVVRSPPAGRVPYVVDFGEHAQAYMDAWRRLAVKR